MTEFIFIRHAESAMNLQPHLIGGLSVSAPLSKHGHMQARLLGAYLRQQKTTPDIIFSSGIERTNATARIALEQTDVTLLVTEDQRLLELDQGPFEGALRADVYTAETIARYNLGDLDGRLPGGESILDVQLRGEEFLHDQHTRHPDSLVLVFGHGLAIRSLAGRILGHTKQQILSHQTDNVSITAIDVVDDIPSVRYIGKNVIEI